MATSLRTRLIVASVLWTSGLLLLMHLGSMFFVRAFPMPRAGHGWIATLIGLAVALAGLFAARSSLVTLRRLRQKVSAVSSGEAARIDGAYPSEVQPLIDGVNSLLADRERSVERARATAGDLAHSLKTPLALLAREADTARAAGNVTLADSIEQQIRRMANQVDYHLTRARIAASAPGSDTAFVAGSTEGLIRTMSKVHAEKALDVASSVPPGLRVRLRREDLDDILGNVLDNACKWAQRRLTVTASDDDGRVTVVVEDDGPGLPEKMREAVLERGVRLDEAAPGSGLGLAIVRDLIDHYGGSIALDRSPLGGLRVTMVLPGA